MHAHCQNKRAVFAWVKHYITHGDCPSSNMCKHVSITLHDLYFILSWETNSPRHTQQVLPAIVPRDIPGICRRFVRDTIQKSWRLQDRPVNKEVVGILTNPSVSIRFVCSSLDTMTVKRNQLTLYLCSNNGIHFNLCHWRFESSSVESTYTVRSREVDSQVLIL